MTHVGFLNLVWEATTIEDLRAIEGMSFEEEGPKQLKLIAVYYALDIHPAHPEGVYGKLEQLQIAQAKGEAFYQEAWEKMAALDKKEIPIIIPIGILALILVGVVVSKRRGK